MESRIKNDPKRLFDCFLEVVRPVEGVNSEPWVLQSYPAKYKEKQSERLKSVPYFVFPCSIEITAVQSFSFVMTDVSAQWTFGFVRQAAQSDTALVFLSSLPWHDTFYRMLNQVAELLSSNDGQSQLHSFLEACYNVPRPPDPGTVFHVTFASSDFICRVPQTLDLPTIPENRNLTEYFNAVGVDTMLDIFAAMLHERRIVMTSRKLSRLSACVQAANTIIYPMSWQHIFIPILPKHLITYLSAPMPFLIGVPAPIMKHVKLDELGEVVILDADANKVVSPFLDLQDLPQEVVTSFWRTLKAQKELLGDTVARAFLRIVVHLIGGYREALKMPHGEKIAFDEDKFVLSRPQGLQPFLREMLQLQVFRQFVEGRLALLNDGKGFSDEFEKEAVRFAETAAANANAGHKIKTIVRKEGGALVKAVKSKANPAMKQAVKTVRAGGKSAYKGMRSKVRESTTSSNYNLKEAHTGSLKPPMDYDDLPHSAPASPTATSNGPRRVLDVDSSDSVSSVDHPKSGNVMASTPKVLKYERFDPPPMVKGVKSSPELEQLPALNLDLMNDMRDLIYRQDSHNDSVRNSQDCADLISFGAGATLGFNEEHEVIFDPLAQVSQTPKNVVHSPATNSSNYSASSENLLQEYGLDFGTLSLASRPMANATVRADQLADLDPLKGPPQNGRSVSVISPMPRPVVPPRTKRKSVPADQAGNNFRTNWTTFD